MPTSINGWPVLKPGSDQLVTKKIPGVNRSLTLERVCAPLLLAVAHDWDAWIRLIDEGPVDEGGYCYRYSRTGNGWSNHSSGTAVDINWTQEGAQRPPNREFWETPHMVHTMDVMRTIYGPVCDFGVDWHGTNWDPMHVEIKPRITAPMVRAHIKKLGITPAGVRTRNAQGEKIEPRD